MSFPWPEVVEKALTHHSTPFYLSAWSPVEAAVSELSLLESTLPVKHWLSFKTHPIAPLVRSWRRTDRGIEVVSEFELLAATSEGFHPQRILVNGVGKHGWLQNHEFNDLWVNFDSLEEVEALARHAKDCRWNIGIRCHVKEEFDPDEPQFAGQFGMNEQEIANSQKLLRKHGINVKFLHFHLRSNVPSADCYWRAFEEVSQITKSLDITPAYVSFGGGLPVVGEQSVHPLQSKFDFVALREVMSHIPKCMPSVSEIWMENGRFVTSRSAVLVVRVIDIKERPECRYLICDGGRTNHALVSDWEIHNVFLLPARSGPEVLTTICGPTCMAFDRLARMRLPRDIKIGDYVVWMNAGAYHIPWETRFSHGFAKVLWLEDANGEILVAREAEDFARWWSTWQ